MGEPAGRRRVDQPVSRRRPVADRPGSAARAASEVRRRRGYPDRPDALRRRVLRVLAARGGDHRPAAPALPRTGLGGVRHRRLRSVYSGRFDRRVRLGRAQRVPGAQPALRRPGPAAGDPAARRAAPVDAQRQGLRREHHLLQARADRAEFRGRLGLLLVPGRRASGRPQPAELRVRPGPGRWRVPPGAARARLRVRGRRRVLAGRPVRGVRRLAQAVRSAAAGPAWCCSSACPTRYATGTPSTR